MVEGLTRYQTTPPSGATVVHDRQSLNDIVKLNPETVLHPENGGFYLKTLDDEVVAIAGDDLCIELDAAVASLDARHAAEIEAEGEASQSPGVTKRKENLACYPHCMQNYCSHPRCFTAAVCLSYSHCHVCLTSSRKECI
jgi:hypothetical protein